MKDYADLVVHMRRLSRLAAVLVLLIALINVGWALSVPLSPWVRTLSFVSGALGAFCAGIVWYLAGLLGR